MADLAGLAANAGAYRTQQEDQEMALRAQAAALHAQQVQDEIAHQHAAEAMGVMNLIATDRRQRDLFGQRADLQYGLQGMRDEAANQRTQTTADARRDVGLAQVEGLNYRSDQTTQARRDEGAANRASREGMQGQRLDAASALAESRNDNLVKAAQIRAEAQKARANPAAYQAAAGHAKDLVDFAYRHRQGVARQLEGVRMQLANLPPVGTYANQQRQQLARQEQELMRDLSDAEGAYHEAITSADQIRRGAVPQAAPQTLNAPTIPTAPAGGRVFMGAGSTPLPGYGAGITPAAYPTPAGPDGGRYFTQSPVEQSVMNGRETMRGFDLSTPPDPSGGVMPGPVGPVQVRSRDEALSLPSGTVFIDPYGVPRVRP